MYDYGQTAEDEAERQQIEYMTLTEWQRGAYDYAVEIDRLDHDSAITAVLRMR